jgi:glycosyltransferase involved in cell wall biosynthesis
MVMSVPLSIIVITKNEERNIRECLESVRWAGDIVIVDAESTDATVDIAREYTDKVHVLPWQGFAAAKTRALEFTENEWVLWLDADERVLPETAEEISTIVAASETPFAAYRVARRAYFLGRRIRHCGWYPSYATRLFRKSLARFSDSRVHEHLVVDGPVGTLRNDFLHFTDDTLEHYYAKFNAYTSLAAEELAAAGKTAGMADLILRPCWMFFKMYFLRLGFLDGVHGLILCKASAGYVFAKYAKLWLKTRKKEKGKRKK